MEHFQIYIICLVAGLLGTTIQILVKLNSLQKKAKAGNAPVPTLGSYIKDDMIALVLGVVFLVTVVYLLGDNGIKNYQDLYANWSRSIFVFVGYGGSDLAVRVLGRASDKINQVIDTKTNIADGKI